MLFAAALCLQVVRHSWAKAHAVIVARAASKPCQDSALVRPYVADANFWISCPPIYSAASDDRKDPCGPHFLALRLSSERSVCFASSPFAWPSWSSLSLTKTSHGSPAWRPASVVDSGSGSSANPGLR